MTYYRDPIRSRQYTEWYRQIKAGGSPPSSLLSTSAVERTQKVFADRRKPGEIRGITKVDPPAHEVHSVLGVPYSSQEHALESVVREQVQKQGKQWDSLKKSHQVKLLKGARGLAVNRDDLTYKPEISNADAFSPDIRRKLKTLPTYKVDYSHNSALNRSSFMDADGNVAEVTHAVSPSDYRLSPTTHLLRRVSDQQTGETIFYAGRPETEEKALEQAKFIAAQEIAAGEKGKIIKNEDGSYTMPYVVSSHLPSSAVLEQLARFSDPLNPSPEFERRYLDQERELLRASRTIQVTVNGETYTVKIQPILVHQQLNNLWDHGERAPTWLLGEGASKEILKEGLDKLQVLAHNNPEAQKHLKVLKDVDNLTPEEMLFHMALLCRVLNIPQVLHCKSSKDKTGLALAHTMAAYNWQDCRLPKRYDLILGKTESRFEEERELVALYKTLFTTHLLDLAEQMSQYGMGGEGTLVGEDLEDMHGLTIKECPLGARSMIKPYIDAMPTWRKICFGLKYFFGPAIYSAPMAVWYGVKGVICGALALLCAFQCKTLNKEALLCTKKFGLHVAMCFANLFLGAIPTAFWGLVRLIVGTLATGFITLLCLAAYGITRKEYFNEQADLWSQRCFDCLKYGAKDISRLWTFYKAIPKVKYSKLAKDKVIFKRSQHKPQLHEKVKQLLGHPELTNLLGFLKTGTPALTEEQQELLIQLGRQMDNLENALAHSGLKKQIKKHQKELIEAFRTWEQELPPAAKIDYLPENIYQHMLICAAAENPAADRMTQKEKDLFLQLHDGLPELLADGLSERRRILFEAIHDNGDRFLAPIAREALERLPEGEYKDFKAIADNPPQDVETINPKYRPLFKAIAKAFPSLRYAADMSQKERDIFNPLYTSQRPLLLAIDALSDEAYEHIRTSNYAEMEPKELEFLLMLRNEVPWTLQQEVIFTQRQRALLEAARGQDLTAVAEYCVQALSEPDFTKLSDFLQNAKADPQTLSPYQLYLLISLANISSSMGNIDGLSERSQELIRHGGASTLPAFKLPQLVSLETLAGFEPKHQETLAQGLRQYRDTRALEMEQHGPYYLRHQFIADTSRDSSTTRITFNRDRQNQIVVEPRQLAPDDDAEAYTSYVVEIFRGLKTLPPLEHLPDDQMPITILAALEQTARSFKALPFLSLLTLEEREDLSQSYFTSPTDKNLRDPPAECRFSSNGPNQICVDYTWTYTLCNTTTTGGEIAKMQIGYRHTFTRADQTAEWESEGALTLEPRMIFFKNPYCLTPRTWITPATKTARLEEFQKGQLDITIKDLGAKRIDPEKREMYRARLAELDSSPEKRLLLQHLPYARILREIKDLSPDRLGELQTYLANPTQQPSALNRKLLLDVANNLTQILSDATAGVIPLTDEQQRFLDLCKNSNAPMFKCIKTISGCKPLVAYQAGDIRRELTDCPRKVDGFARESCGITGAVTLIRGDIVDLVSPKKKEAVAEAARPAEVTRLRDGLKKVRGLSNIGDEIPDLIRRAFTLEIYEGLSTGRSAALQAPPLGGKIRFHSVHDDVHIEIHDLGENEIRIRYIVKGKMDRLHQGETGALGVVETTHSLCLRKEDGLWSDTSFNQTESFIFKFENRDENFVLS